MAEIRRKVTIGVDFGTLSARAVVADTLTGEVLGSAEYLYPHGVMTDTLPDGTPLPEGFALADPGDYEAALFETVPEAVRISGVLPEEVAGIGLDATSSTSLPLDRTGRPLSRDPAFASEPHAFMMLWKHHGAVEQAERMTRTAKERGEHFLRYYGGTVNAEWMLPKLLEIYENAPRVFEAADNFLEAGDYLTSLLTGETTRNHCTASHKLLYTEEDGFPGEAFLEALSPGFGKLLRKLRGRMVRMGDRAGLLTPEAAEKLGLRSGTPVAAAGLDAHVCLVSAEITGPDHALLIAGTSCCLILCTERQREIPGMSGCVYGSVLPGLWDYEAGQSAVGDLFSWFTENAVPASYESEARGKGLSVQALLTEKAARLRPGESGLIALDWWNGNRSCLADPGLSGLILGLTLQTKPEEIYRALLEACAFGMRAIIEEFEKAGVPVREITASGGISAKNSLLMQIYADVLRRKIRIAAAGQGSALGSAIYAAVAGTGVTIPEAARAMGGCGPETYTPDPENAARYDALYAEYRKLLEYFGKGGNDVMKHLRKRK
jgi:L-ribulokinase